MLILDFNVDIIEKIVNLDYNNNIIQCKLKENPIYKLYHTNKYFREILKNRYNTVKKEIYYFKKFKKRINTYNNQLIKLECKIQSSYYYPINLINYVNKTSDNIKRYIIKRKEFSKLYNMLYNIERRLVKIYNDINFLWNEEFTNIDRYRIEYSISCIQSIH